MFISLAYAYVDTGNKLVYEQRLAKQLIAMQQSEAGLPLVYHEY
jgi:hypothetical protein